MADKDVRFILTAVDKATGPLKRVTAELNRMQAPANLVRRRFADLASATGFGKVGTALAGVGRQLRTIGLYAGGAAAGFGYFLKNAISHADEIGDTAEKIGLTAQQFQALSFAAEQAGAKSGAIQRSIPIFLKNMSKLGKKGSPIELLTEVAERFEKVQDPARRARIAIQMFGKSGIELVPLLARGREGIEELFLEFQRSGGGISDEAVKLSSRADEALRRLGVSMMSIKGLLLEQFAPAVADVAEKVSTWVGANRQLIGHGLATFAIEGGKALTAFLGVMNTTLPVVKDFVEAIGGWKIAAIGLAVAINVQLIAALGNLAAAMASNPILAAAGAVGFVGYGLYKSYKALGLTIPEMIGFAGARVPNSPGGIAAAHAQATAAQQVTGAINLRVDLARELRARTEYVTADPGLDLSVSQGPVFGF